VVISIMILSTLPKISLKYKLYFITQHVII
jgi:hypothetical protein